MAYVGGDRDCIGMFLQCRKAETHTSSVMAIATAPPSSLACRLWNTLPVSPLMTPVLFPSIIQYDPSKEFRL